jgi:NADPH-ferrihemoprotein reductase
MADLHEFDVVDAAVIVALIVALVVYCRRSRGTGAAGAGSHDSASRTVSFSSTGSSANLAGSASGSAPPSRSSSTSGAAAGSKSLLGRIKNGGKNLVVFFGSQTGTAEEYAGRLVKESARFGLHGITVDCEELDSSDLENWDQAGSPVAIFCMATYGEGDPTDNAKSLWDWLKEEASEDNNLSKLRYTVFALGNKTYEHYNAVGKFVDKRLGDLHAQRVYPIGLGDDDGNMEEDFNAWKEEMWPVVCATLGVECAKTDGSTERNFKLVKHEGLSPEQVFRGEFKTLGSYAKPRGPYDVKNPFLAKVVANRELHTGGDRSCVHVELNIKGSNMIYDAGDHVGVFPTNDPALVQKLGEITGQNLDEVFSLVAIDGKCAERGQTFTQASTCSPDGRRFLQSMPARRTRSRVRQRTGRPCHTTWMW